MPRNIILNIFNQHIRRYKTRLCDKRYCLLTFGVSYAGVGAAAFGAGADPPLASVSSE